MCSLSLSDLISINCHELQAPLDLDIMWTFLLKYKMNAFPPQRGKL